MGLPPTVLDRALTLCRNGEVRSWQSLRDRLAREGIDADHPTLTHHRERLVDALQRAEADRAPHGQGRLPSSRRQTLIPVMETPDGH